MTFRRALVPGAIVVFVAVLAVVAVAAFQSEVATLTGASTPPPAAPAACSPQPCATIQRYDVWVDDLQVTTGSVRMTVSFRNASSSTHADPSDFSLIEANGHPDKPIYNSSTCPHWPRTEFANGARRGPFPLCFQPANVAAPLRLHWEPDFGFACCDTEIRLT